VPASRAKRVAPRAQIVGHSADTKESAERLLDTLVENAARTEALPRASRTVDLVVGSNRIVHNLGRKPIGATITPTVADASFAWALGSSDDRIAIITIVGVAQPKATIEFY
jgi:hypothetical protein